MVHNKNYSVNDVVYQMDTTPYIENGRVFIPFSNLAQALGVSEKMTIFDAENDSLELHSLNAVIKIAVNDKTLYKNNQSFQMDVTPVRKDGTLFLPAKWVAEALGYAVGWDENTRSLLFGPPGNLPEAKPLQLTVLSEKVRDCQIPDTDLWVKQRLSSSSILFTGDSANVYNAGVAARYVNGFVLEPSRVFSFNGVEGERTAQKGFIKGYDIKNNITVGGGVCRASTVLFQTAREAGLNILERHPHSLPVHYASPGTDATVSWGSLNLKFKNNLGIPIVINAGLEEGKKGRLLWSEMWQRTPLTKVEVAVIKNKPTSFVWEEVEKPRLTALMKEGVSFASIE